MPEQNRALGYLFPACKKIVLGERTEFALKAATAAVPCACGRSELTAENDGRVFRVTVPCGVCGGEHRAEVPIAAVLEGSGVALACPSARLHCCYIGEPYRVKTALEDLELSVQRREEGEAFTNDTVMYEILSELKDIAARDGISCSCGSRQYTMEVLGGAVDLICQGCGGRLRIPAATDGDLDSLCCHYTLTIKGRPRPC